MNRVACAALAVALSAASAYAADLGNYPEAGEVAEQGELGIWSGAYIGVHGGSFEGDIDLAYPTTPDQEISSWHAGIQAGYQRQYGQFVLGVEADVSFGDLDDSVKDGNYITQGTEIDVFGTVRGRLGVALGRFMPYVTGGLAWQSGSTGENCPAGAPFGHCSRTGAYDESDSFFETGWAYGGGLEVMVTENVSLKGEYVRLDFGSESHDLGPKSSDREISQEVDLVRAGLNYRF